MAGSREPLRLAVLIDADNAQPSIIEGLLQEVARLGAATVRRIYGDWTRTAHGGWKRHLLAHSIQPVQQFAYTSGKNATDSALIIDAMDLLYTRRFDGFCLVSSDSDFTRLAVRIREEGLQVYGFGERKTPQPFVAACNRFIYTELLRPPADDRPGEEARSEEDAAVARGKPPRPEPKTAEPGDVDPAVLLRTAVDEVDGDGDWVALAAVGAYLNTLRPDFDPRLFGHRKLSDLFAAYPGEFELRAEPLAGGSSKLVYVRLRS
ncbi:NYN domain-containing protein [Pseudomarimonas salicorniae]|uniref:NYN domain-containing protein n=1 Tax=Pseudomarimonas salicorniae TaxID=2933270 RepID=A0ABT0GHI3_9GAMM|nr:NYN domain-containing protein [Lysobacter sp. CAU 1642]MCK7594007.1 NYN domain-containing protein [Lysobacter sp. CAU 1642]